jgi:pimeloyl-ACP methyl ester carboxylesterase
MIPIAEVLAPHHRIYAPDLPGFGESGKPAHALNLAELTDALAAIFAILTVSDYLHQAYMAVMKKAQ